MAPDLLASLVLPLMLAESSDPFYFCSHHLHCFHFLKGGKREKETARSGEREEGRQKEGRGKGERERALSGKNRSLSLSWKRVERGAAEQTDAQTEAAWEDDRRSHTPNGDSVIGVLLRNIVSLSMVGLIPILLALLTPPGFPVVKW